MLKNPRVLTSEEVIIIIQQVRILFRTLMMTTSLNNHKRWKFTSLFLAVNAKENPLRRSQSWIPSTRNSLESWSWRSFKLLSWRANWNWRTVSTTGWRCWVRHSQYLTSLKVTRARSPKQCWRKESRHRLLTTTKTSETLWRRWRRTVNSSQKQMKNHWRNLASLDVASF